MMSLVSNTQKFAVVALTLLGLAGTANAATKTLNIESGQVEFLAIGWPSFIKVKGEGVVPTGSMTVADGKASGEFQIQPANFKTGMSTRDEHMRKALEVEKFPTAIIRFKDIEIKEGVVKTTIPAEVELHGQKKTVPLEAEFDGAKASGKLQIKLTEFGVTPPSFAGATVKDEVDVTIQSVLK